MDLKKLLATLHPLERKVVPHLAKHKTLDALIKASGLKQIEVMRALQWLENKKVLKIAVEERELISLDANGKTYLEKGLPERRFLEALEKKKECTLKEIISDTRLTKEEINVCIGLLKRKQAIDFKEGKVIFKDAGKQLLHIEQWPEEKFLQLLEKETVYPSDLRDRDKLTHSELSKRKGILKSTKRHLRSITLLDIGKKLVKTDLKAEKVLDRLTSKMLIDGSWKNKTFRRYDVTINVPKISGGKRHFVNQAIAYIKKIWLDLGFKEMTGNMVQTAYWNLDALFIPQDHPARTMQDTFYVGNTKPELGVLPRTYKKVKAVHEDGGNTGSTGWQIPWSEKEASQVLLRTHTTVLSAQTIANLKKSDLPAKFFSVDKVYRNEALDWCHLFEFFQVEGIVVDPNANLKHLKGYLREFYNKMGFPKVRMRPGFFPYCSPSLEVDVFHPVKKVWLELGGAGIFRPEVVEPLLGFDCPVLAWGQGMGRYISEYWNITDIRDLYKNDLKQINDLKLFVR